MKYIIAFAFLLVALLGNSQDYMADTLSVNSNQILIRYTLVADTAYIHEKIEQIDFEIEMYEQESNQVADRIKDARKKKEKYEKELEKQRKKSSVPKYKVEGLSNKNSKY